MTFNNVINHLKSWCCSEAELYYKSYTEHGGLAFLGYQFTCELIFKLSTLMDRPFEGTEDFKSEISDLIDTHYLPAVSMPENNLAKHIIKKTNRKFFAFLEDLMLKTDDNIKPNKKLCRKFYTAFII